MTPLAHTAARTAIQNVDVRAADDANALAATLFLRQNVRYCREFPETFATLGNLLELRAGDCDDMCAALVALLIRLGYPAHRIRWCIGWKRARPVHVWVQFYSRDAGRWVDLDPSTFLVEPGQNPAAVAALDRVTTHPLEV